MSAAHTLLSIGKGASVVMWETAILFIGPTRDLFERSERPRRARAAAPAGPRARDELSGSGPRRLEPGHQGSATGGSGKLAPAIVERKDMSDIGFCVFELWELDQRGENAAMVCLAPARLVANDPSTEDIEYVKRLLTEVAEQRALEIVRAAW
jgi:hypothetical protein